MKESKNIILTWDIIDSNNVEFTYFFYGSKNIEHVTVSINSNPEVKPSLEQMIMLRTDVRTNLASNPKISTSHLALTLEDWAFSGATMPSYHGDEK